MRFFLRNASRKFFLLLSVVLFTGIGLFGQSGLQQTAQYVPNRVIVKFKSNGDERTMAPFKSQLKTDLRVSKIRRWNKIDTEVWDFAEGNVPAIIAKWKNDPRIKYIEPDYILRASVVPNDPNYGSLWGMSKIQAAQAWDTTTGSDVIIGVIDSGVDYLHPDLAANIWTNPGEIPGNGIDDDGNGYIDDVHGYDFINNDSDPMDDNNHGTHCSGTIAGVGNNGIGVAGINWTAKIMALKVLDWAGSGTNSAVISAILYATQMGAKLTSNSYGGGGYSQAMYDAINAAGAVNSLFVAAAGNDNTNFVEYPAGYDLDNIISVAATDINDDRASFSNYDATWVDLGAPGVGILSTTRNNTYSSFSGTSMACPHVAGAAALIWARGPLLSNKDVKDMILSSVDPVASLAGITVTGGRLNLFKAIVATGALLRSSVPVIAVSSPSVSFSILPDANSNSLLSISNTDVDARKLDWSIASPGCSWLSINTLSGRIVGGGTQQIQFTANAFGMDPGNYQCTVNINSNDPVNPLVQVIVHLEVLYAPPPVVSVSSPSISFVLITGNSADDILTVSNTAGGGSRNLHWSAAKQGSGSWLTLTANSGVTAPGAANQMHVVSSAIGLTAGVYRDTINMTTNDPDKPLIRIPIQLTVSSEPVTGQKIYTFDGNGRTIRRANLDGSNAVTPFTGLGRPDNGAIDKVNRKLYWADWSPMSIKRADLDGANNEILITSIPGAIMSIALDVANNHIYFTHQVGAQVYRLSRANLDGSNIITVGDMTTSNFSGLEIDHLNNKLYWFMQGSGDHTESGIWRSNLDLTNREHLVTPPADAISGLSFDFKGGKMYWGETYPRDVIRTATLDGNNQADVLVGYEPLDVAVDPLGGKIYWTQQACVEFNCTYDTKRANLDGSNIQSLGLDAFQLKLDVNVSVPAITVSGTFESFVTCAGTASAEQSFTVAGTDLDASLDVTAPAGFEVSLTPGSGFATTLSLTPANGTVSTTTIYVRVASSATGTPSGNITAASTAATTQSVAVTGTVNPSLPASVTIISDATNNSICSASGITFTATPTNGGSTPSYQWFVGAIPVGTNSPIFSSSSLVTGNVVTVQMTSNANCATGSPATSTGITVIVNPLPSATINGSTVVCQNANPPGITFTGSGGTAPYAFTYNVFDGTNTISGIVVSGGTPSVTVPVPTATEATFTYTLVNVQDGSSTACSQAIFGQTATVTVTPLPSATIGGGATVCQNAAQPLITFTGSAGTAPYTFTYSLFDGVNTTTATTSTNISAPTSTPGTYTYTLLSVKDASVSACSQTITGQTATVNVNPLPNATIAAASPVTSVSTGNTASVADAGIGATYTWGISNGTITGGTGTRTITYKAGVSGSVSLSVDIISVTSCGPVHGTLQVLITPQACPKAAITVASAVCSLSIGNIASVADAGTGATYAWTITNGTITAGSGTRSITFKAGAGDGKSDYNSNDFVSISVKVTNSSGVCTVNSGSYKVYISPYPKASINVATSVCTLSTGNIAYVLSCGSGATYSWTITNGTIISGSGTYKITYKAGTSGSVTLAVTVTNNSGCAASSGNKLVTIVPYPTAVITAATSICAGSGGNTASVTSSGSGAKYAWTISNGAITSGSTTNSITYCAGSSGSVTLSANVTNSGGCSTSSGNKLVTIIAAPSSTITTTSSVCGGSTNTASVAAGASSYLWTITNGTIPGSKTSNTISYIAGASGTAALCVTVTGASGCKSTGKYYVTIKAQPSSSILTSSSVCVSSTGNLASVSSAGTGATYSWTISNGTITSGGGTSSVKYTAGTSGSVTLNVTVKNSTGCQTSGSRTVTIQSKTTALFVTIGPLCKGAKAPTLPATSTNGITGTWNPSKISTTSTGTKTYTFTPNSGQCGLVTTISITVKTCNNITTDGETINAGAAFNVLLLPNPSSSKFTLIVKGNSNETAEIRIFDMLGRFIQKIRTATGQTVHFGEGYVQGVYIVQVLQGSEQQILKAIKQ